MSFVKYASSRIVRFFPEYSQLGDFAREYHHPALLQKLAGYIPIAPHSHNYLYVISEAIHSFETHKWNNNYDAFERVELLKGYPTFVTAGVYRDHDNDDSTKAIGICLDAWPYNDAEYVDVLMALSRRKSPEECKMIESKELTETSMGVVVGEAICSICGNIARDESEFCPHIVEGKGRQLGDEIVFEYNRDLNFFENTLISPYNEAADPDAGIRQVLATKRGGKEATVSCLESLVPLLQEAVKLLRSEEGVG